MNRHAIAILLAQLVSGVPDAGSHGALETNFHLNAIYREQGASNVVPIPLQGTDGAIPLTTPHWSCAWSLRDATNSTSLIVQCYPLSHDQAVSTSINCDRSSVSKDLAVMLLTTRDSFEDREPKHVTELKMSCQTAVTAFTEQK